MELESLPVDEVLAIGAIALTVIAGLLLIFFFITVASFKMAVSWIGNQSPGWFASAGWVIAISMISSFISLVTVDLMGSFGAIIGAPINWYITLYMISSAGDCGMWQAFKISCAQALFSGISLTGICIAGFLVLSSVAPNLDEKLADFESEMKGLEAQMAEIDSMTAEMEGYEGFQAGSVQEVQFNGPTDESTDQSTGAPSVVPAPKSKPASVAPPVKVKRRADGTTSNPFFQD